MGLLALYGRAFSDGRLFCFLSCHAEVQGSAALSVRCLVDSRDCDSKLILVTSHVYSGWYLICLVLGAVFGIVSIAVGQTTLTVSRSPAQLWLESDADLTSLLQIWGYIVALLLGVVIAPLSCFLDGVMGTGVSTNAISKMVSVCLRLFLVICIEY